MSAKEYIELMMDKVDEAPENRLKVLEEIEKEKVKIAKAYKQTCRGKIVSSGRSSMENDFTIGDSKW
jgi:Mg/Co/Ni transporter MgtE